MQCEGWRRTGGAFTFGPVKWEQCENDAVVMIEAEQEDVQKWVSCMDCWNEAIASGIKILSVVPLGEEGE